MQINVIFTKPITTNIVHTTCSNVKLSHIIFLEYLKKFSINLILPNILKNKAITNSF